MKNNTGTPSTGSAGQQPSTSTDDMLDPEYLGPWVEIAPDVSVPPEYVVHLTEGVCLAVYWDAEDDCWRGEANGMDAGFQVKADRPERAMAQTCAKAIRHLRVWIAKLGGDQ
jgi:hypothetical protein